jgi:hypothetical protein
MAGPGLEDITLQDGFEKLLISENADGISGDMTNITTSIGVGLANSVLWMGQGGDGDSAPHLKIKAKSNSHRFFTVTDGGGNGLDGSNEYDILSFKSDGSGGSGGMGRGVWSGKCQIDISDRGRLEFCTNTSTDNNDSVPTIKQRASDGSIEFEMETGSSKYWKFDRLEISAGTTNANAGTFHAPGVDFSTGTITAEAIVMSGTATLLHQGTSTQIENTTLVSLKADDTHEMYGAKNTKIEAQSATAYGDASVWIDALTDVASGSSPAVRIGTQNATSRVDGEFGTKDILIGDNARDDAELKLNSRKVSLDNSMLVFDIADGSTWNDGIDSSPSGWDGIGGSEASLFAIEETSIVKMKWFDGKNNKQYQIEQLQEGKSRTHQYDCVHATSTTVPSSIPTHSVVQYVKEGQTSNTTYLIWKFNNGTAEVYQYINLDSTSAQQVQYSLTEPV